MWYIMAQEQRAYELSERLVRAITGWNYTMSDNDVEEIIMQGADVNRLHGTLLPLHCASMVGELECVQLLIEHGAQVNRSDGFGRYPVHYAAERNPACLEYLLANSANCDSPGPNQDTPLHWAAFKDNHQCARILLSHGSRVDPLDHNNDTPICWAAMKGNLKSIQVLLDYNARVDVVNSDGKSPISRITTLISSGLDSAGDLDCLELLLKASGQISLRDRSGSIPAIIASDNRLAEVLVPCCVSPRSLKHLCRTSIRRTLGRRFLPGTVANSLPLPHQLQEYVLLKS